MESPRWARRRKCDGKKNGLHRWKKQKLQPSSVAVSCVPALTSNVARLQNDKLIHLPDCVGSYSSLQRHHKYSAEESSKLPSAYLSLLLFSFKTAAL